MCIRDRIETETLERLRKGGKFIDIARHERDEKEKLYSWWSYRAADWTKNNKGRRLDHIWVSDNLLPKVDIGTYQILRDARGCEKPSDHVPCSCLLYTSRCV